jgi:membrane-bound ClpP family serine protease
MLVFAVIFGIGFAVLILSLIFGGDGDVDYDAHLDGVGSVDGDTHGPNIFSVKMIALLLVGFGAVGFGVRATTEQSMFQSSLWGVGGAIAVGIIGYAILRMFYASQTSSTISDDDVVGQGANVIDAIIDRGNGQVTCVVRGREMSFIARAASGETIERGTPVRIISKSGNVVTVKPIES